MENQVARRRISSIAGHFIATDDISTTYLLPMNCSSSLNRVIRRYDNRMYFSRQGSDSQACFMRQVSSEQTCQNSSTLKCSGPANKGSSVASNAPLFGRSAKKEPKFSNAGLSQPVTKDCKFSAPDPPAFARPTTRTDGQKQFCSKKKIHAAKSTGIEWSPRMDVAESVCNFVATVELPGVAISGMRVEVNDQNLIVMGKRSTQWWTLGGYRNNSILECKKRESSQGSFQVVWPLPMKVNKDNVSAEFVNGLLQITIPKL